MKSDRRGSAAVRVGEDEIGEISWEINAPSPPALVFTTLMGVDLNRGEILIGRAMEHFPHAIKT